MNAETKMDLVEMLILLALAALVAMAIVGVAMSS